MIVLTPDDPMLASPAATAEWLTDILRREQVLPTGHVANVESTIDKRSNATLIRFQLTYSNDALTASSESVDPSPAFASSASVRLTPPERLILKFGGRSREVVFHREIAPQMQPSYAVRCFDAALDPATDTAHRLFEDVSATHSVAALGLPPTGAEYAQLVDALATVHAQWWQHPRLRTDFAAWSGDVNGFIFGRVAEHYPRFAAYLDDRLWPSRRAIYERVLAHYPRLAAERITNGRALTLIHGDAHPANFLLPTTSAMSLIEPHSSCPSLSPYLIDWEDWRVEIATNDLAFLLALPSFASYRARIERPTVARYHARLVECGVTDYSFDHCWHDYRVSVISNVYWPVFWSSLGDPMSFWFPVLERALQAYEDLECAELLP